MTNLTDLGFSKGIISETIVSTYDAEGQPNAAPMGAIMENENRAAIKLFNSSLTFENLKVKRSAVINVTSNINLFYWTAFKEACPEGKLPIKWFEKAETVNAPKLHEADAFIEVSVANLNKIDDDRTEVVCDVKLVVAAKNYPQAYCRALFATVEAIIHATRVKVFLAGDEKHRAKAKKLLETIATYQEVVERSAPHSRYSEIITELAEMVDSWRKAL